MIEQESGQVPLFSTWQPAMDFMNQESPDMYEDVYDIEEIGRFD